MRRFLALIVLSFAPIRPAAADTTVVLPFFNLSKTQNLDWIGESVSETIREALASEGVITLDRQDRIEAYRRLSIRENAPLTRAAELKVGEALDADQVVYGQYFFSPATNAGGGSRGSLRITAHVVDRRRIRQSTELAEAGALEDLAALQNHLAWQTLRFLDPKTAPTSGEFTKQHPAVRLDAIENYMRGLAAPTPEQKHRLFAQAARLDSRYSQPCFQLGKISLADNEFKVAADWLERVAAGDAHYREANFLLGLCRYHLGDYQGAEKAFQLIAQAIPLNEVFNNLGASQCRRSPAEALENFRRSLDGDRSDPVYHFNAGYALWKLGKFEEAADSFRAVLARDSSDTQANLMLGRCLKGSAPKPSDTRSEGLERLKSNYEEGAYWQLKALLQPGKDD